MKNVIRTKWTERKFTFDAPLGWLPNVIERLHGTHPRLLAMTEHLSSDALSFTTDCGWCIKDHIGHLSDLEALHNGRLDDFTVGKETLRPADMSNKKTESAAHHQADLNWLLRDFEQKRSQLIERFRSLSAAIQNRQAFHPRLKIIMRPIDVAIFTAEHDDHHLASIRTLIATYGS